MPQILWLHEVSKCMFENILSSLTFLKTCLEFYFKEKDHETIYMFMPNFPLQVCI